MVYKTLKPHVTGDTCQQKTFVYSINQQAPDFTGASARMHLRINPTHPAKYELSTTAGNLEFETPGKLLLKKQVLNFPANIYYWDIEITMANGDIRTDVGGTWAFIQDVTH